MAAARARSARFQARDEPKTVLRKLASVDHAGPVEFSDGFAETFGRLAPAFLRYSNVDRPTVGRFVRAVAADHGGLETPTQRELCSTPTAEPALATFSGRTHVTEITSHYSVHRPLSELAATLDPRVWDQGGDVFVDTHRVQDLGGRRYPHLAHDPDAIGASWEGLLYERAEAGPTGVEQILNVKYEVVPQQRITATYSVYDSIATRYGPFDLPGLIQQNSGVFEATPDGPNRARLRVVKRLQYGRLSQWSGQSWDFGELFNYLAPAVLTLWVNHLQSVVPCSDRQAGGKRSAS
jgi:hypothetical protein